MNYLIIAFIDVCVCPTSAQFKDTTGYNLLFVNAVLAIWFLRIHKKAIYREEADI